MWFWWCAVSENFGNFWKITCLNPSTWSTWNINLLGPYIPPTKDSLQLHISRSSYYAGFKCGLALEPSPNIPSPELYGWFIKDGQYKIKWMNIASVANSCKEYTSCGCTVCTPSRCKCMKYNLKCTALCKKCTC